MQDQRQLPLPSQLLTMPSMKIMKPLLLRWDPQPTQLKARRRFTPQRSRTMIHAPTVEWTTASQTNAESVTTFTITAQLICSIRIECYRSVHFHRNSNQSCRLHDHSFPNHHSCRKLQQHPITITVVDDAINEASETVIATMGTPTNATQGATTVHTATIIDNDAAPTVAWTAASQTNAESVTTVTFTAQLSAVSGQNVTVPFM
jgi:hypothetical protein